MTNLNVELGPKRLELLHELLPAATIIAVLVNPTNPNLPGAISRDLQAAARTFGLQLHVLHASTERDFDTVFATWATHEPVGSSSAPSILQQPERTACRTGAPPRGADDLPDIASSPRPAA